MISRSHGLRAYMGFPPACVPSYGSGAFLAPAVLPHRVSADSCNWYLPGLQEGGSQSRGHYSHRAVAPGAVRIVSLIV